MPSSVVLDNIAVLPTGLKGADTWRASRLLSIQANANDDYEPLGGWQTAISSCEDDDSYSRFALYLAKLDGDNEFKTQWPGAPPAVDILLKAGTTNSVPEPVFIGRIYPTTWADTGFLFDICATLATKWEVWGRTASTVVNQGKLRMLTTGIVARGGCKRTVRTGALCSPLQTARASSQLQYNVYDASPPIIYPLGASTGLLNISYLGSGRAKFIVEYVPVASWNNTSPWYTLTVQDTALIQLPSEGYQSSVDTSVILLPQGDGQNEGKYTYRIPLEGVALARVRFAEASNALQPGTLYADMTLSW